METDFIIVGGGIVGLATAYRLRQARPSAHVRVLEKETDVALHQTGRNSGVVHSGVYYEPGSLKARLCRAGLVATREFAHANQVPFDACGKLIVATNPLEVGRLRELMIRAERNGVTHRWIEASELREIEPNIQGHAALHLAETGMIDYRVMARRLAALLIQSGVEIELNARVIAIRETAQRIEIDTPAQTYRTKRLIVCAGLLGDRLARAAGLELDFSLIPFRGDYHRLAKARAGLIKHHIYPVPEPTLPFLGVHLTRLIEGGISVGPSAMLAFHREGYGKASVNFRDSIEMFRNPGLWRLLRHHARAGAAELGAVLSRRFYLRLVQKYCPSLTLDDFEPHPSGIRAQAVTRDGKLVHDFLLRRTARALFVCNAPSPAATSALPIADEIIAQLE
ncbi:MAG: L-2-hydroxyglutarate oxidase [Gammaproteobacteria bacterium]|nr:L-2-hydroxyglutarate oxidase [Gammaproteobacteria bacterium]